MNKMKKGLAVFAFMAVAVGAIAGNVSAAQYGDNVVSDAPKYNTLTSLQYDANSDGYFNVLDLVRTKKAAAGEKVEIDKSSLGLKDEDIVQAEQITKIRIALFNK